MLAYSNYHVRVAESTIMQFIKTDWYCKNIDEYDIVSDNNFVLATEK